MGKIIGVKRTHILQRAAAMLLLGVLILPLAASAQLNIPPPPLKDLKFSGVITILNRAISWFFTVFLIVAVVFVIIAAFRYLTSGGSPEGVKTASRALFFAAVAIGVALLSVGIRMLVEQLVTGA